MKYILLLLSFGLSLNNNGMLGVQDVQSAHTSGHLNFSAGIQNEVVANSQTFSSNDLSNSQNDLSLDQHILLSQSPWLRLGLGQYVDISLVLPVYSDFFAKRAFRTSGVGDLLLRTKWRLPTQAETSDVEWAVFAGIWAGTAQNKGAVAPRELEYLRKDNSLTPYGQGQAHFDGGIAVTYDFTKVGHGFPLLWHLNASYHKSLSLYDDVLGVSTAFAFPLTETFHINLSYEHKTRPQFIKTKKEYSLEQNEVGLEFQFQSSRGFSAQVGASYDFFSYEYNPIQSEFGDYSVNSAKAPKIHLTLAWQGFLKKQDDDKDGFENKVDNCPLKAEDIDGFEDYDGCPEPDNDKDNILDVADKCPLLKEDLDGFEDTDGCPDYDNDKDGKKDDKDKCPLEAEDFDGFEDADGCPELDNDQDKIPDTQDKCKNFAEDLDGFEDEDGCPELDNDKDGVPDERDRCPNVPENINGIADLDGCPDGTKVSEERTSFPFGKRYDIVFKKNSSQFTQGSFRILDRLVAKLKVLEHLRIKVKVHSDNKTGYDNSLVVTGKQARALKSYFVSQGIPHQRIIAVGVGSGEAIATNKNPKGRSQNQRIEFVKYQ